MNYVIGSGPAGVAAAASLLDLGLPVTLLDAGGELSSRTSRPRPTSWRGRAPEQWSARDRDRLKGLLRLNAEGAPLKLAFGSDYIYRDVGTLQPVVAARRRRVSRAGDGRSEPGVGRLDSPLFRRRLRGLADRRRRHEPVLRVCPRDDRACGRRRRDRGALSAAYPADDARRVEQSGAVHEGPDDGARRGTRTPAPSLRRRAGSRSAPTRPGRFGPACTAACACTAVPTG